MITALLAASAEDKQCGLAVSGRYFLLHPPLRLISGSPDESIHELFILKSKSTEMEGASGGPCPSSIFSDVGCAPRGRLLDTVCLKGHGL